MRIIYSGLFYLLVPFIVFRLLWRSIKAPAYRSRWSERFACYDKKSPDPVIWFHAVSVGEVESLFPLVKQIQQQYPKIRLLITTTTPTGSARVKTVMKDTVEHVYLPYDFPDAVSRFIQHFKPKLGVIMETEIWPNLFSCCAKNDIPLYLVNARVSEKSVRGYQKIPALIRPALMHVKLIAAQTEEDAERFIAIGALSDRVAIMGNIKFDVDIPNEIIEQGAKLKADLLAGRFVWMCASTHKDEEEIFLDVYRQIKPQIPELLLLIAPRHPERFPSVKSLCEQRQLAVVTHTSGAACLAGADVYLLDTMGALKLFYAASDVAFVGGSMVSVGGHNILEAAAVGVPVLFGPFMFNFKDIAEGMLKQTAALQCRDKEDIAKIILALYSDRVYRTLLAANGKQFIRQNQGASARIYDLLQQSLRVI